MTEQSDPLYDMLMEHTSTMTEAERERYFSEVSANLGDYLGTAAQRAKSDTKRLRQDPLRQLYEQEAGPLRGNWSALHVLRRQYRARGLDI